MDDQARSLLKLGIDSSCRWERAYVGGFLSFCGDRDIGNKVRLVIPDALMVDCRSSSIVVRLTREELKVGQTSFPGIGIESDAREPRAVRADARGIWPDLPCKCSRIYHLLYHRDPTTNLPSHPIAARRHFLWLETMR
jgi:hypothetical protein